MSIMKIHKSNISLIRLKIIIPIYQTILAYSITFGLFLIFLLSTNSLYAWSGYDYENKSEIDVGPGNLVREGLTFQFYDMREDDYHTGKVVTMESVANGTRILLEDLDSKKERIFIMGAE